MNTPTDVWDEVERMLQSMIDLQESKVLALARRLKPGVTAEDVRNAHDHRELDDADLQFEDGTLAGILAAQAAVRARRRGGSPT